MGPLELGARGGGWGHRTLRRAGSMCSRTAMFQVAL